jgi:hypothetical protein
MEETRWEGQNFSEVVAPEVEEEEEEEEGRRRRSGKSLCLFWDKYKTHKYSAGKTSVFKF